MGTALIFSYLVGGLRVAFLILGLCCMVKYLRS